MNFFDGIYTLQEIAIHHNFCDNDVKIISKLSNKKNINKISSRFPMLKKFVPYCELYNFDNKYFYGMAAYIYDTYKKTGFLIDIGLYDLKHDINKKEYWQYNPSISLDLKPQDDWQFAENFFKDKDNKINSDDIWKIFLAGCARMDYYQHENTDIQKRIKYAIVEYMLKRPQFFTTDDFIDNPILHKKYEKK